LVLGGRAGPNDGDAVVTAVGPNAGDDGIWCCLVINNNRPTKSVVETPSVRFMVRKRFWALTSAYASTPLAVVDISSPCTQKSQFNLSYYSHDMIASHRVALNKWSIWMDEDILIIQWMDRMVCPMQFHPPIYMHPPLHDYY
jgi:hypothetical protein